MLENGLFPIILSELNNGNEQIQILYRMIERERDNNDSVLQMSLLLIRENHARMEGFFEEWIEQYLEYDFFSLFRMTRETMDQIMIKINAEELNKNYTGGGQPVLAEKQLMMTLWWLGKGETIISVSEKFNVALSTVYHCCNAVLEKIVSLLNEVIVWPDISEVATVEMDFMERSGFPGEYRIILIFNTCNLYKRSV